MRTNAKLAPRIGVLLLAGLLGGDTFAQQLGQEPAPPRPPTPQKPTEPGYRVRVTTEIVLVNVIARDKKGNLIKDL